VISNSAHVMMTSASGRRGRACPPGSGTQRRKMEYSNRRECIRPPSSLHTQSGALGSWRTLSRVLTAADDRLTTPIFLAYKRVHAFA
jgi:hypothetical protein